MLILVGSAMALTAWILIFVYGIVWFRKYRGKPQLDAPKRARWLFTAAILFLVGGLLNWAGAEAFPKVVVAWFAVCGLCSINAAELMGWITTSK